MKRRIAVFSCMLLILAFSACGGRKQVTDFSDQPEPPFMERFGNDVDGFWHAIGRHMQLKKISPEMEIELKELMGRGCMPDYKMLENDTAYLYSIIPGAGQIYTGEPKKAFMYLVGSFLIVPYLVAFEDAQSSVDYINAKYSIDYCREKLRLSQQREIQAKNKEFLSETKPDQSFKEKNREFMEQLMQDHKRKLNP